MHLKRFSLAGAALLLLTACSQNALPKEEVFNNAMSAIQMFTSASFVLHAKSDANNATQWSADATGDMASAGKQLRFDLQMSMGEGTSFKGSIIVPGENEVYVKADSLSLGQNIAPVGSMIQGTWWALPSGTGSDTAVGGALSPDPSLLSMQLQTLEVTKEHGIQRLNQRKAYMYDVTMNKDKLLAYLQTVEQQRNGTFDREQWQAYLAARDITGTVWIDAETFLPDRLSWTVVSSDPADRSTITFDVTFARQNEDVSISPPSDAKPLPLTVTDLQQMMLPADGTGSVTSPVLP